MGPIPWATGRRGRRPVAQRRMWPQRVVHHTPLFDHDLRLLQRVKDFSIQALVPQLSAKALTVAVLPRTPRFDIQPSYANTPQPLPQFLGHELRTVVRANTLRDSPAQHHVGQRLDYLVPPQPSGHA